MSKGPGRVQTELYGIFSNEARRCFSTRELCRKIFGVQRIEKKHRVSVIRALRRISEIQELNIYRAVVTHSIDDFWFIYGGSTSALNSLLHKAGARNVNYAPAKDERPRKKSARAGRRRFPASRATVVLGSRTRRPR
jgi:hypothetical protein